MSVFYSDPGYGQVLRRIVAGCASHTWVAAGVLTIAAAGVLVMLLSPESKRASFRP